MAYLSRAKAPALKLTSCKSPPALRTIVSRGVLSHVSVFRTFWGLGGATIATRTANRSP